MNPYEWLHNKVAADLGVTSKTITDSTWMMLQREEYAKGIIFHYEDLIVILHDKLANTAQKGK